MLHRLQRGHSGYRSTQGRLATAAAPVVAAAAMGVARMVAAVTALEMLATGVEAMAQV